MLKREDDGKKAIIIANPRSSEFEVYLLFSQMSLNFISFVLLFKLHLPPAAKV